MKFSENLKYIKAGSSVESSIDVEMFTMYDV